MKVESYAHEKTVHLSEIPCGMVFKTRSGEFYMMTKVSYAKTNKYYCVHLETGITDTMSPIVLVEPIPKARVGIEY